MPGLDGKELIAELKICKKKPRNFLFAAGSKLESHYLDLSKKKIPKSKAKEAKAAAGSPKAYAGVVEYDKETGDLVFKTKLGFADKQTKALRMLVKKRAGLKSFNPVLKLVEDLQERDFDDEAVEGAQDQNAQGQGAPRPAEAPSPPEAETQEVRPDEGQPEIPTPQPAETQEVRPDEGQPETMEAGPGAAQKERVKAVAEQRKAFTKARKAWVTVRDQAQRDLELVKDGITEAYLDDPDQLRVVKSKINELDEIFENLNDDLRDTLDAYVATPAAQARKLDQLADEARGQVRSYLSYVNGSKLLDAVDQKEFANVTIKPGVVRALKALEKAL